MLIKTLNGKIVTIDIGSSDITIKNVKKIIEYATGIPADQQRLVCHGIDLEDHQTVSYYNIKDDTTVHLIRILHGGINNSLLPPFDKDDGKAADDTIMRELACPKFMQLCSKDQISASIPGSWEKIRFWPFIQKIIASNPGHTSFCYDNDTQELSFKLYEKNPFEAQLKQVYPIPIYENQLTDEMIAIIKQYTRGYYWKINMRLLSNFDIDWNYTNKLRSIIRSLHQSNIRSVYYRGVSLSDIEINYYKEKLNKFYYTNSFSSFTTEKELAFPYNTLIILKTTPGNRLNIANVWKWSSYPHEMEAILSVGSKLKVLDVGQENDKWIIQVELVGNE